MNSNQCPPKLMVNCTHISTKTVQLSPIVTGLGFIVCGGHDCKYSFACNSFWDNIGLVAPVSANILTCTQSGLSCFWASGRCPCMTDISVMSICPVLNQLPLVLVQFAFGSECKYIPQMSWSGLNIPALMLVIISSKQSLSCSPSSFCGLGLYLAPLHCRTAIIETFGSLAPCTTSKWSVRIDHTGYSSMISVGVNRICTRLSKKPPILGLHFLMSQTGTDCVTSGTQVSTGPYGSSACIVIWTDIKKHLSSNINQSLSHLLVCCFRIFIWFSLSVASSSKSLSSNTWRIDGPAVLSPFGPWEVCLVMAVFLSSFLPRFQMFHCTLQWNGCQILLWLRQWPQVFGCTGRDHICHHPWTWNHGQKNGKTHVWSRCAAVFLLNILCLSLRRGCGPDPLHRHPWFCRTACAGFCFGTDSHTTACTSCCLECNDLLHYTSDTFQVCFMDVESLL